MKSQLEEPNLFELDWASMPESIKSKVLNEYIRYTSLSRRIIGVTGSYKANLRSLMIMLFISLALTLNGAENRTIVLAIVSLQFLKTLFTRIFEANLHATLDLANKNFIDFLNRTLRYKT